MVLYFSIIMFRLYFLYLTLADWQDWYQGEESMTGCDYHEYRKDMYTDGTDGGCRDHFDFSDHLVMTLDSELLAISCDFSDFWY